MNYLVDNFDKFTNTIYPVDYKLNLYLNTPEYNYMSTDVKLKVNTKKYLFNDGFI